MQARLAMAKGPAGEAGARVAIAKGYTGGWKAPTTVQELLEDMHACKVGPSLDELPDSHTQPEAVHSHCMSWPSLYPACACRARACG